MTTSREACSIIVNKQLDYLFITTMKTLAVHVTDMCETY